MVFSRNEGGVDERGVSWKVCLDLPVDGRILALGVTAGDVLGLARTWTRVDWLRDNENENIGLSSPDAMAVCVRTLTHIHQIAAPYDLIVLGTWKGNPVFLHDCLGEDGLLACMNFRGCDLKVKQLKRAGFATIHTIAAVPTRQPRLFFPQQNNGQKQRGLSFHVPGRWWLRWLLRGLRWIVGLGWPVFPGWRGLYLAHKKKECHSMGGVAHAIEKKLGWVTQGWVVYAGSDLPRRKVTLLAFNQETNREWVIKLADSPSGQGALQQETQALETLARSSVSGHVPTLILPNGSWMGHAFMVQSMLARSYSSQSTTWTPAHREFLQKLKYMDIHLRPMGQTSCWQRVVRGFQTSTTWPDAVRKTYSCLTQDDLLRQEIPCCRSHGDFAPWNIRWEDGKLFVIDWEESEPDGLMIGDLFYFFYCQLGRNPRIRPMDVFLYFNHSMAVMDQKKEIGTQILVLMLRLWLLERFIRSGEIQAMQLLDFFAPDGSPPWKND